MESSLVQCMLMVRNAVDAVFHKLSEHSLSFVGQSGLVLPHQAHGSCKELFLDMEDGPVFNCESNRS